MPQSVMVNWLMINDGNILIFTMVVNGFSDGCDTFDLQVRRRSKRSTVDEFRWPVGFEK